jgi:hypothetical protein
MIIEPHAVMLARRLMLAPAVTSEFAGAEEANTAAISRRHAPMLPRCYPRIQAASPQTL